MASTSEHSDVLEMKKLSASRRLLRKSVSSLNIEMFAVALTFGALCAYRVNTDIG